MISRDSRAALPGRSAGTAGWRAILAAGMGLSGLTTAAVLVHGYHPAVEDAEIYLPAIRRLLNPGLYPHDAVFFSAQTKLSLFPQLIALSIRASHIPFDWALFFWHAVSIFLLLGGCWRIAGLCLSNRRAQWFGVALVASLLTMPVAGTALYIMDQYLCARSLSTAASVWSVARFLDRKWRSGLLWLLCTFAIHPLMAAFVVAYLAIWFLVSRAARLHVGRNAAMFLALPATDAYRQAVGTRSYLFLSNWRWHEWLGALAPLAILWWLSRMARKSGATTFEILARSLAIFGLLFLCAGVFLGFTHASPGWARLQPMRSLLLVYIIMLLLGGGLLEQFVFRRRIWLSGTLLLVTALAMFYAQRQQFPSTPHIEGPWRTATNDWVGGFQWVRDHTPPDSYFALNPGFMTMPGEDEHGFRALAERSRLADIVKDPGAVTIAPSLAESWQAQVEGLEGWQNFQRSDFSRLRQRFGVNWVVLEQPGRSGLDCPFQNRSLLVCRVPNGD